MHSSTLLSSKTMAWGLTVFLLLATPFFHSPHHASAYRVGPAPRHPVAPLPAIRGGYWPSGLNPTFPPSSIDFSYFTHIFYAFVGIDSVTFKLNVTSDDDSLLANFTATLHRQRHPVKALLSIGGGGFSPSAFANLASTPANRSAFISSTIAAARKYGLDGFDLDWEFPENPEQMANLGELFIEWRHAIDQAAAETGQPRLLLTSAVYFASHFFLSGEPRSYPAAAIKRALDWVNVMCYDYHGGWDTSQTGEHAALYDPLSNVSTSYGIGSWIAAGLPREKLAMGLPLYGRTWRLKDPANHGVGAPAVGLGPGSSDGTILYSAVVEFNTAHRATVVHDKTTVSAYSYAGTDWIGYDDPATVARKVEFARQLRLGGYFFWALGYDSHWTVSRRAFVAWRS